MWHTTDLLLTWTPICRTSTGSFPVVFLTEALPPSPDCSAAVLRSPKWFRSVPRHSLRYSDPVSGGEPESYYLDARKREAILTHSLLRVVMARATITVSGFTVQGIEYIRWPHVTWWKSESLPAWEVFIVLPDVPTSLLPIAAFVGA